MNGCRVGGAYVDFALGIHLPQPCHQDGTADDQVNNEVISGPLSEDQFPRLRMPVQVKFSKIKIEVNLPCN